MIIDAKRYIALLRYREGQKQERKMSYVARKWKIDGKLIKAMTNGKGEYWGVYNGKVITQKFYSPEQVYRAVVK